MSRDLTTTKNIIGFEYLSQLFKCKDIVFENHYCVFGKKKCAYNCEMNLEGLATGWILTIRCILKSESSYHKINCYIKIIVFILEMGWSIKCVHREATILGLCVLVHPSETCTFALNTFRIKDPVHKIWDNCVKFLYICCVFPIF